jgi:hypothetical protein
MHLHRRYLNFSNTLTLAYCCRAWAICAVYESDLTSVDLGEKAERRLTIYAGKVLSGIMLFGGKQVIKSDLDCGQQIVSNATALQKAVDQ